jgi:hypothetical protein
MKLKKEIIVGSGKTAYLIACSKDEIKLLYGIAKTARRHFPETFELSQERHRLNNILKELEKIYEQDKSDNIITISGLAGVSPQRTPAPQGRG